MKKLILSVALMAFAVAVQAGDAKTCAKDKAACSTTKVSTTKVSDGGCCSKTTACQSAPSRQTLMSPKGAEQAVKLIASR